MSVNTFCKRHSSRMSNNLLDGSFINAVFFHHGNCSVACTVWRPLNSNFAYQSFLQEKRIWHKDKGRMCSHSIISWHKDEKITQEEVFAFGQEFAEKWFARFQTVIAVHQDRDHIHCHLIANSVSYEDGRKYHTSKKDL